MKPDLGILFLHYATDARTRQNLSSIQEQNPTARVVSVSAASPFPNGYTIDATPQIRQMHQANPSRSSDWLVCSWFLQRREQCRKWWIAEWDTFARQSVFSYYRPVWSVPFVCSSVRLPYREPEWSWFRNSSCMPDQYRPFLVGAVPFIYLLSDVVIVKVCTTMLETPLSFGNGELRFSTIANKCGFPPCAYSPPNDRITWMNWGSISDEKTIFHPVKQLIPKPRKSGSHNRQRNRFAALVPFLDTLDRITKVNQGPVVDTAGLEVPPNTLRRIL